MPDKLCMRVLVAPHLHQPLALSVYFYFYPFYVRDEYVVVLIWIYLMANEVLIHMFNDYLENFFSEVLVHIF